MHGFLLIDKQVGWTSHDVVGYLRKITRIKKIGHAGTLDPFATGLLIVGIGREATKRIDEFKDMPKVYEAVVHFGAVSDTFDSTGDIKEQETCLPDRQAKNLPTGQAGKKQIDLNVVNTLVNSFVGEQDQIAPMYSAKKVNGEKLYDLARKGIEIERKPHRITIHDLQVLDFEYPLLKIKVTCSPGTYIRTLAHDIGKKLGVGAYCEELRRTSIGKYSVEHAFDVQGLTLETIEQKVFE